jgi:type IV secretion system protein VirD4
VISIGVTVACFIAALWVCSWSNNFFLTILYFVPAFFVILTIAYYFVWGRAENNMLESIKNMDDYLNSFRMKRNAGIYGDAGWAYTSEIEAAGLIDISSSLAILESSIYLANFANPYGVDASGDKWASNALNDKILIYSGDSNSITTASPRTGKGTTEIIPTLLLNNESCFVFDVKGENFFITHLNRFNRGHKIIKINPFNIFGKELGFDEPFTECFNPLQNLDPNSPNFISEIDSITSSIVFADGGTNTHFDSRARDLVSCLIAHVCSDKAELENGFNNLPRVRQIIGFHDVAFIQYMQAAAHSSIPLIRDNAATFINAASSEIQGVKATAATQLRFLNNPQIAHFLSRSDFQFEDMRTQPMTVYCMLPSTELEKYNRFARLMVQSMFTALSRKLPATSDRRVLVILDEIAQLRKMDIVEKAGALLNGYKVRIWSIFQSEAQAKDLYGEGWKTFYDNAETQQYLQPSNHELTQKLSDKIGYETQESMDESTSRSVSTGDGGGGKVTTGVNTKPKIEKVIFMTPQEIAGMPKDRKLIFVRGLQYPIMGYALRYYEQSPTDDFNKLSFYGREFDPHPIQDGAFEWMRYRYNGYEACKGS